MMIGEKFVTLPRSCYSFFTMVKTKRKYPVGVQDFEKLRTEGYVYVDKTPLIYKMISEGGAYFLSRPRRFGKSLLVSTLAALFEGKRHLFEAFTTTQGVEQPSLYIAQTDWRWEQYPVLRFDFSAGDLQCAEQFETLIDQILKGYEQQYGLCPEVEDTNIRMMNLLREAHTKTGKRVVVLVDEYDNFILHSIGDAEKVASARHQFQNLFGPLKANDEHVQFIFITGISKFSQMGIFSKLNNLQNISMNPAYDALCGITEEELHTQLRDDIRFLGDAQQLGFDEQLTELKRMYDGYHFSEKMTDVYNPFSLIIALRSKKIDSYWFDRGTSSALFELLGKMPPFELKNIDGVELPSTSFDLPVESFSDPLPVLYQTGYLTIRKAVRIGRLFIYTLGFPNSEVRMGFADCLFSHVASASGVTTARLAFLKSYNNFLATDELPVFLDAIKAFFAGIPYQLTKDNQNEHFYHALLYTLLIAFGADIRMEESSAMGRADITLLMPRSIYVIELKYDKGADEALQQIEERGYAEKYQQDGRPVVMVGISFSSTERNITEWKMKKTS